MSYAIIFLALSTCVFCHLFGVREVSTFLYCYFSFCALCCFRYEGANFMANLGIIHLGIC